MNRSRASHDIALGVAAAALMILLALAASLAAKAGLLVDTEWARRSTMIVLGAYLALTGNALPKRLTPLATSTCDPVRAQAIQRVAGWTQVLTGLIVAAAWIVAPTDVAEFVTVVAVLTGVLVVSARIVTMRRGRNEA